MDCKNTTKLTPLFNKTRVLSAVVIALHWFTMLLQAQEIKKDVTVVTAYKPVVQDFTKISLMPVFDDTLQVPPQFNYVISPIRVDQPFVPRPVSAARMAQEPIKKLYNNYLKLGLGNPYMPLAEVSVSNGRSKENAVGVFLRHHSASGNVLLSNIHKIEAPFADNEVDLYGKRKIGKSVLSGNLYYTGNKFTFYGIDTAQAGLYKTDDNRQHYQKGGFNISFQPLGPDSNKLLYAVNGGFYYLGDNYNNNENAFNLKAKAGKNYAGFFMGSQLHWNYYQPSNTRDTLFNSIFTLKPFIEKTGAQWRLQVALGLTFNTDKSSTALYSYPSALFEFVVAPSVLKAFVAYQGHLENNNTDKIRFENPYILPGEKVKNTHYKTHIYGGLNGNFSSHMSFLAKVSYSAIENQYFFVPDTLSVLRNHFQAVHDNVDLIQVTSALTYTLPNKLGVSLTANYYGWQTFRQEKAWNMPVFDATLAIRYNLQNKIILTSDWLFTGERLAKAKFSNNIIELKPYTDVNLGVEYRYTKVLSAFVQIRNLTASKYQIWPNYPAYRFQFMAGFTYIL